MGHHGPTLWLLGQSCWWGQQPSVCKDACHQHQYLCSITSLKIRVPCLLGGMTLEVLPQLATAAQVGAVKAFASSSHPHACLSLPVTHMWVRTCFGHETQDGALLQDNRMLSPTAHKTDAHPSSKHNRPQQQWPSKESHPPGGRYCTAPNTSVANNTQKHCTPTSTTPGTQ